MQLVTVTSTDYRLAKAWYVKYPLDAYALGPMRFEKPVSAFVVSETAQIQFGERPNQIWPDGQVEEVDEYEFELDVPDDEAGDYQ